MTLNGILRHKRKITLHHRNPARATISKIAHAFHLGASITPSHVHILLVGHLIKRQGSIQVIRSSPLLQAGTHGQARPTTRSVCHAENTRHSPKLSISLGHPSSPPTKRCLIHHGTRTPRAPTRRILKNHPPEIIPWERNIVTTQVTSSDVLPNQESGG
jgi:hypothetical protein